jgi:hypothetical protein
MGDEDGLDDPHNAGSGHQATRSRTKLGPPRALRDPSVSLPATWILVRAEVLIIRGKALSFNHLANNSQPGAPKDEAIYVIGDACIAGDMPKSGFSANSQAKVAAMNIRADLSGSKAFPAKYSNTFWSLIETGDGVKIGAQYEPKDGKITALEAFVSKTGEDAELRKSTYEESIGWYDGIVADMFS